MRHVVSPPISHACPVHVHGERGMELRFQALCPTFKSFSQSELNSFKRRHPLRKPLIPFSLPSIGMKVFFTQLFELSRFMQYRPCVLFGAIFHNRMRQPRGVRAERRCGVPVPHRNSISSWYKYVLRMINRDAATRQTRRPSKPSASWLAGFLVRARCAVSTNQRLRRQAGPGGNHIRKNEKP